MVDAVELEEEPADLAITPDGTRLLVAFEEPGRIAMHDTESLDLLHSVTTPGRASHIAIAPEPGTWAFASLTGEGKVLPLRLGGNEISVKPAFGERDLGAPGPLVVTGDVQPLVYVVDRDDRNVDRDGRVVRGCRLLLYDQDGYDHNGAPLNYVLVQRQPTAVTLSRNRVYVANGGSDDISVINAGDGRPVLANTWRLGSGRGEKLSWSLQAGGKLVRQISPTSTHLKIVGERPGPVLVQANYLLDDHTPPFTFEVRLKSPLDQNLAVIRKDQYDLAMNVLNTFRPIGVEVITLAIREHVRELQAKLSDDNPDTTYPDLGDMPDNTYPDFRSTIQRRRSPREI